MPTNPTDVPSIEYSDPTKVPSIEYSDPTDAPSIEYSKAAENPSIEYSDTPEKLSIEYSSYISRGSVHSQHGIPCQDVAVSVTVHSGMTLHLVLDGHGVTGHDIATEASRILVDTSVQLLKTVDPQDMDGRRSALAQAFRCAAHVINSRPDAQNSGCTASMFLVGGGAITVANIGDSEVVWAKNGKEPVPLSRKHCVDDPAENLRVFNRGARIQGGYFGDFSMERAISVTRAFGDLKMRDIGLISDPYMRDDRIQGAEDFAIVATDGFWDANGGISAAEAVSAAKSMFDTGASTEATCEMLVGMANGDGHLPFDDIAILLIKFLSPQ